MLSVIILSFIMLSDKIHFEDTDILFLSISKIREWEVNLETCDILQI